MSTGFGLAIHKYLIWLSYSGVDFQIKYKNCYPEMENIARKAQISPIFVSKINGTCEFFRMKSPEATNSEFRIDKFEINFVVKKTRYIRYQTYELCSKCVVFFSNTYVFLFIIRFFFAVLVDSSKIEHRSIQQN